ncbi:MAG: N-6 DNA methylase [Cyclobacteriaceae bacterium]
MKTQEVPQRLRGFFSVFDKICGRWDQQQVFDDFLTMALCAFALQTEEDLYFQTIKKYDLKELNLFPHLLAEWVKAHDEFMKGGTPAHNQWFDSLGTFYEMLRSNYKASKLGQFFTPESLCSVMAQITMIDAKARDANLEKENFKILDPCCGSGRLPLAMNAIEPGKHFFVCQDIDFMCVKMTALNMLIHGMEGQVLHMDTLRMDYFTGFSINHMLKSHKASSIIRLKESEKKEPEKPRIEEAQIVKEEKEKGGFSGIF